VTKKKFVREGGPTATWEKRGETGKPSETYGIGGTTSNGNPYKSRVKRPKCKGEGDLQLTLNETAQEKGQLRVWNNFVEPEWMFELTAIEPISRQQNMKKDAKGLAIRPLIKQGEKGGKKKGKKFQKTAIKSRRFG